MRWLWDNWRVTVRWLWDDWEINKRWLGNYWSSYYLKLLNLDFYESKGSWNVNCEYDWLTETFEDIEPPTGLKIRFSQNPWLKILFFLNFNFIKTRKNLISKFQKITLPLQIKILQPKKIFQQIIFSQFQFRQNKKNLT